MASKKTGRPTIGFLSTWSVYEGTTIDNYNHSLLQGVCAASRNLGVNLLIGCGISLPGSARASRTAWPVPGPDMDFVPVGPWNTDGLIIIPDDFTDPQFAYVQDLVRTGFPVVLTTAERPGPLVAVDNAGGIRRAFDHLRQHGHSRIAYIAGKQGRRGDSAERLDAYCAACREAGLPLNPSLIAYGEHRYADGRTAMERILAAGEPFTAVLASNDLSGLGAIAALRAAGLRVPGDVAVIGFDDVLEARSQQPPLTTVRHPTFLLGYQAVVAVLAALGGAGSGAPVRVPTQLVIRQSCGCRPEETSAVLPGGRGADESAPQDLAARMAEAAFVEVRRSAREEVENECYDLLLAFLSSVDQGDPARLDAALQTLFEWTDSRGEEAYVWDAALSTLRCMLAELPGIKAEESLAFAESLVDRTRLAIAENAQRQANNVLLRHMETSNRLGLMTSQLLATLDLTNTAAILAEHLPRLGIANAVAALYTPTEDDPVAGATLLLATGLPEAGVGRKFQSREFPPAGLYGEGDFQQALLPLLIDERTTGFVSLEAKNLELCAAVVHNLAASLRANTMYRDALEGRRLAEEANQLKSRFLSMVSHELRTPLSLIVGLSEMVMNEEPDLSDSLRRDVQQIHLSSQHLARLIGDVLDLASSEAGQLRILREPLDLAEVLRMTDSIGARMAREKGLEWHASLPQRGPLILGDRTRLRQVTLNLINNAVKFTAKGRVELKVSVTANQVQISVSDTGMGVTPEDRETIFREFYRSERTIQTGHSGLGLGLAISRQLVERHGGRLNVRSPGDLGSGSTFSFSLPIVSATVSDSDLAVISLPSASSVVVLVERTSPAEELCSYLRGRGFNLRVFRVDQDAGWQADVASAPPAAIILTNRLAAREGWDLIGMLKRQKATEGIPVLAYALDEKAGRGGMLEIHSLQKPLRLEQLAGDLEQYCSSGKEHHAILVVDDDPGILDLHCRLVSQIGCQAITARNGREALESLEKTIPDLILLDLMMPEMDGFAVIDALQARESWREIPVVVLTARVLSEADLARCNRGVATVLSKGVFSAAETLHHVEAALTRQQTLGRATQRLVRQATACIHTRFAEPLTREDIARQIGISPDYLTDCFRQELGVTPMIYLRRYRIRRARELLEAGDLSILQVAQAVGFSESAHFTRTFQRETGMTPRAYRSGKR